MCPRPPRLCVYTGRTSELCETNIAETIAGRLAAMRERGAAIPTPTAECGFLDVDASGAAIFPPPTLTGLGSRGPRPGSGNLARRHRDSGEGGSQGIGRRRGNAYRTKVGVHLQTLDDGGRGNAGEDSPAKDEGPRATPRTPARPERGP